MDIEHTFELLGETVTVHTNSLGNSLTVKFGDTLIEDSSGDCIRWPNMGDLHGAALRAAEEKVLRQAGENAIASFIKFAAEELKA